MSTVQELQSGLAATAARVVGLMPACGNEQSTRLYLVLPMLGLLGYDASNPYEVYPDHAAAPVGLEGGHSIDFAVLQGGQPVIGVACVQARAALDGKENALRAYFSAAKSVRVGILTNGTAYRLYVDAEQPGVMDSEPVLSFDLELIATGGVAPDVLETLALVTKERFAPDEIAEQAHLMLVRKRLRSAVLSEAQAPSEALCRALLARIGFSNVPKAAIDRHYATLVKAAIEEALVLPVAQRLGAEPAAGSAIASSERELALFNYIRRRLAFLVKDEALFAAIERVDFQVSLGRVTVFVDDPKSGVLFELVRGGDGRDEFVFPDPAGATRIGNVADIDAALAAAFAARVRDLTPQDGLPRVARTA